MTLFRAPGFRIIAPAWKAKLEANLPLAVDWVNTEAGGEWLIDVPRVVTYAPAPMTVTTFPTVGMIRLDDAAEDDVGREWTGVYSLGLIGFVQCSDPEGLASVIDSMRDAVLAAALADRRLVVPGRDTMTTGRVTYLGTAYGPALADVPQTSEPPQAYLSWFISRVQSRHDESAL